MLQYLLNVTLVWLLSLVVFDLFLRRETFHDYNRIYLLFTFILGIGLPLIPWHTSSAGYTAPLDEQIYVVSSAKAALVAKAAPTSKVIDYTAWLWRLYLSGVVLATLFLLVEVVKLARLYNRSKKIVDNGWTIIETGVEHSPFSLWRMIFVCSRSKYDTEEWNTVFKHEQQHGLSLHFIDVFIMQCARILFWLHPLVYIYQKRLFMIHEYQADQATAIEPRAYSKFLVDQALLAQAPQITHSFNRSPIKNRITMLTHHSSPYRHLAKLLVLPLMAVFLVCCTKSMYTNADRPTRNGDLASYKSNTIKFSSPHPADTVIMIDPKTGNQMMRVVKMDAIPVMLNTEPILTSDLEASAASFSEGNLRTYILKQMKNELCNLPDGSYKLHLQNIVIGKDGKLAYFEYNGFMRGRTPEEMGEQTVKGTGDFKMVKNPNSEAPLDKTVQESIDTKFYAVMNNLPSFTPAQSRQTYVAAPSIYDGVSFWNYFKVKDHQLFDFDSRTKDFAPISSK